MSASASISTSHAYTSLLSTLHERSSLLSSAGSTIPPSLNRTLKRQLDAFARSIEEGSSGSAKSQQQQQQQRRDVRLKWDRIREALEDDEDGRRALLSVRDGHPNLFLYHDEEQEREENEEQSPHPNAAAAAGPLQDEPYRDDVRNDEEDDATASASLLASQQSQMSTQDRHLDTLSLSISRQHNLSLQMNEELEMQHELLGDLDEDVDRTGLRLGRASGQLDRVKRGLKDHASVFTLFMLIMLLIALIIIFK